MQQSWDTHRIIKNFVKNGIGEAQAEAIVEAIAESRDADMKQLLTKADLMKVENDLTIEMTKTRSEVSAVRSEFTAQIHSAKSQALVWFIGIMVTGAVAIVGSLGSIAIWLCEHYLAK